MIRRLPLALLLIALLGLTACSGPRETDRDPEPEPVDEREQPAYETFDPAPYDAEPAPVDAAIQHDVPAMLMDGEIEMPEMEGPRTVQGYRLQVFSSADKAAAEDVRDEADGWWRVVRDDLDAAAAFPNGLPMEVYFNQPYYRVRLGAFEFRREAEAALPVIQRRFPEAFIVPDVVTLGGTGGQ
ncbi:MAG: SPOR domain-containing protein [Rhodothermales bacterium]